MISAVIFDPEGTLLETEELKAISYARAVGEPDPDVDEEAVVTAYTRRLIGRSRQELLGRRVRRLLSWALPGYASGWRRSACVLQRKNQLRRLRLQRRLRLSRTRC